MYTLLSTRKLLAVLMGIVLVTGAVIGLVRSHPATALASTIVTLNPTADSYISSASSGTNFGTATELRTGSSPTKYLSYLKFDTSSIPGTITGATLRLYPTVSNSHGFAVKSVTDNTWTETGITWNNSPAGSTQIGTVASTTAGTWAEVDVSSYVTGPATYSMRVDYAVFNDTVVGKFDSREGTNAPQLVVSYVPTITAPTVATSAATSVGQTTATLNGTVNPNGDATTYQFDYGTTTSYGSNTTAASAGSGSSSVAESAPLTGLTASTTYHYRIEATNAGGTTLGSDQTFTTAANPPPSSPPTVVSNPATSVTDTSATLNGSVNPNGSATTYDFEWGTTTSYGSTTTSASAGSGTSAVNETANLTGLTPGTTYHFRLDANNASGTTLGSDQTFTTSATPPATTTTTVNPTADSYVDSSNTGANFGTSTQIRFDGSPVVHGYLRFDPEGLSGNVTQATLKIYANTAHSVGYDVFPVSSTTWGESTITWANAPAFGGTKTGSSGAISANTWTSVDVTSAITGNGPVSFGLSTTSSTAESLSSREGANAPQLVVTTNGSGSETTAPTVATNPASGLGSTTATLNGTVNPNGLSTTYQFDYGTTTAYGSHTTSASAGSGTTPVAESANLTGLTANTVYHYRIEATNADGTTLGPDVTFTTTTPPASAPTVVTSPATAVASTGATLNGTVNPNGASTTYKFDYGTTTSYGTSTTATSAGSGTSAVAESKAITGLSASTTYHFRIEATNSSGTIFGSDQTFTTTMPPPPAGVQRLAFFYPWYPETWSNNPSSYTHYNPSLGFYNQDDSSVIDTQIQAMQYGGMQGGIASWWGQGTPTDGRIGNMLEEADDLGNFSWSLYYEPEGQGDPTTTQITSDLNYIAANYAISPAYLHISGKPVIFVYADGADGCSMATRWKTANAAADTPFYVVLKVFTGYASCADQPDQWHQYSPAVAEDHQAGHSYAISPGFFKGSESTPRLARSLTAWQTDVQNMAVSGEPLQLVTTFNEWGEGTSVESATQWATSSGFGSYLDVMHNVLVGGGGPPPPPPPASAPAVSTNPATSIGTTTATLNGSVNPNGQSTTYKFDWGTSTSYGSSTNSTSAGSGTVANAVSANLSGLTTSTTYHFRLEATNASGTTLGKDQIFTTGGGGSDPVIAAAGDIACDPGSNSGAPNNCDQVAVSNMILSLNPTAVLTLGDNQYETNAFSAYQSVYDPSWGRFKPLIHPGIGNHEYLTTNAAGYFQYFGAAAGSSSQPYYSFNVGTWHIISLNDECSHLGGCGAGSAEETWLQNDLAHNTATCTLFYWHEPRFSSGQHGDNTSSGVMWNDLVAAHADVALAGHNHDYERFNPIGNTPTTQTQPNLDANGIREFIAGTGGKNHYGFGSVAPLTGEVVRDATTYGYLKLTLHPTSYDWQFVNEPNSGSFTDSGTGTCH